MLVRALLILLPVALIAGATESARTQTDAFTQADCQNEFLEIRGELEKRGLAVQKAGERKATAAEACRLLRAYTSQEVRLLKFFTEKQRACQIPNEIIQQLRQSHTKAIAARDNACSIAAAPAGPPPPPPSAGLSGVLGSTIGGPPPDARGGGTIFDTLSGNILRDR